jgi:NADPH:quinone reductase-like Zn-dependent oxidoreductase
MLHEELAALVELWRTGDIAPRVDAVFPFSDAASAHRRITERRNIGKVVWVPD